MSLWTYMAARTLSTRPLSRLSPPMSASYPPPAVAQAPMEAQAQLRMVHDGRRKRPAPHAVQVVAPTVERWRSPSPPTQLVTVMCGRHTAISRASLTSSTRTRTTEVLAILLNRETFLPDSVKYPIIEESTSKTTWGLKALVVCGHLRRPPIGAPKTITLCTVHLHNVVAKKRDAATSLLQRLFAHTKLLEVDFVGGDFNRAAKGINLQTCSATQNSWPRARYRSGVRKVMTPTAQGS